MKVKYCMMLTYSMIGIENYYYVCSINLLSINNLNFSRLHRINLKKCVY